LPGGARTGDNNSVNDQTVTSPHPNTARADPERHHNGDDGEICRHLKVGSHTLSR
jgi:hypothetical protein